MDFRAEPFSKQVERMLNKGDHAPCWDKKIVKLQSELDAYKIALKYFADQSQANREIAKQILTSMEVTHGS